MTKGKAAAIAKNIHADDIEVEDKLTAIQELVDLETYNGITKKDLLEMLRWLIEEYI